jgi:hypothetical protein
MPRRRAPTPLCAAASHLLERLPPRVGDEGQAAPAPRGMSAGPNGRIIERAGKV